MNPSSGKDLSSFPLAVVGAWEDSPGLLERPLYYPQPFLHFHLYLGVLGNVVWEMVDHEISQSCEEYGIQG